MAKKIHDSVYDAALGVIDNATSLVVCSEEPANQAGIAAVTLATYAVDGGDFSIDDAPGGGRRLSVAAQSGNNAATDGQATYVVLSDGTTLLAGTDVPTQTVVDGSPCNVGAWSVTLPDPV